MLKSKIQLNQNKNLENNLQECRVIQLFKIYIIFLGKLSHEENTTKDVDAGFATVEESSVGKKDINRGKKHKCTTA